MHVLCAWALLHYFKCNHCWAWPPCDLVKQGQSGGGSLAVGGLQNSQSGALSHLSVLCGQRNSLPPPPHPYPPSFTPLQARSTDIDALERVLDVMAFGDIEAEDARNLTPLNFIKLFRLAQLTVEYLLFVQDRLAADNCALKVGWRCRGCRAGCGQTAGTWMRGEREGQRCTCLDNSRLSQHLPTKNYFRANWVVCLPL